MRRCHLGVLHQELAPEEDPSQIIQVLVRRLLCADKVLFILTDLLLPVGSQHCHPHPKDVGTKAQQLKQCDRVQKAVAEASDPSSPAWLFLAYEPGSSLSFASGSTLLTKALGSAHSSKTHYSSNFPK